MAKIKICPVCGKEFESHSGKIYCSVECRQKNVNEKLKKRRKSLEIIRCKRCGKKFKQNYVNQKYCSSECSKEAKRLQQKRFWNEINGIQAEDIDVKPISLPNPNCEYGNTDCKFCLYYENCLEGFSI